MYIGTKFLFRIILFFSFTWILLHWLLPFLLPFLLGLLLALGAEPGVRLLRHRLRLPRALASGISVSLTFLICGVLLLLILALLLRGLSPLGRILPVLAESAASGLALLKQWLLELSQKAPKNLQDILSSQILGLFSDSTGFLSKSIHFTLSQAGGILTQVPDQAFTLFTALISGLMISARLPLLKEWFLRLLSRQRLQELCQLLKRLKNNLGKWLLAQLKLASLTLLILTAGLILLRIPYAPLWAFGICLLDALPIFGTGMVLLPWALISLLQGSTVRALGLLSIYVTAALTRSLLEPRLVGKQLGLDPLVTLAAIYGGYRLWGFPGMILSPLLAVTAAGLYPREDSPGKSA